MSDNNDSIKAFAKAMVAFQAAVPPIAKNKTAKAGSFSYNYADLADILNAVRPVLSEHGLCLLQGVGGSDGNISVESRLMHVEGHEVRYSVSIKALPDIQKTGGLISYLRRYSLSAVLGIMAEDDSDGAIAKASQTRGSAETGKRRTPPSPPQQDSGDPNAMTSKQKGRVFAICRERVPLQGSDPADAKKRRKRLLMHVVGKDSLTKCNKAEAGEFIDYIEANDDHDLEVAIKAGLIKF